MKNFFLTLLFLYSLSFELQAVTPQWVKSANTVGLIASQTDAAGSIYSIGLCANSVDFDPGPGTFNVSLNNNYSSYVTKLDQNGNFLWAKVFTNTVPSSHQCFIEDITLDGLGGVIVTGIFTGTVDFDPGSSTYNLTTTFSHFNVFIIKLNTAGDFVWARQIADVGVSAIASGGAGNLYFTGEFQDNPDMDPGVGIFILNGASTHHQTYICKLNSAGNFVWAKTFTGTSNNETSAISVDGNENVLTSGQFNNTADLDPGPSSFLLTNNVGGYNSIFVSKLDVSGNFVWAKQIGGVGEDFAVDIDTDPLGSVYLAGKFAETVDFDPNIGVHNETAPNDSCAFILKLSASGNFVYVRPVTSSFSVELKALDVDNMGHVAFTGNYRGTPDFEPGLSFYGLPNSPMRSLFMGKLNPGNEIIWIKSLLSASSVGSIAAADIIMNGLSKIYVSGGVSGTVDFNPGIGLLNLTSPNNNSYFMAKYDDCDEVLPAPQNTTPPSNQLICANSSTSISVQGYGFISWYTAASGGTYLGGGVSYNTPVLTATTTYYAQDSLCGVSTRTPVMVTVNPAPAVSIKGEGNNMCLGDFMDLNAIASGNYTYTWLPGNFNTSSIRVTPAVTSTYTLISSDALGCSKSLTRSITVTNCPKSYTVKAYIEGYYDGNGFMKPVLFNQGIGSSANVTDSITVTLVSSFLGFTTMQYSIHGFLNTNGDIAINTPSSGSYYLVFRHRNGIETWSSNTVSLSGTTNYNFTTNTNKAYGFNMKLVSPGVYAMYSGDIDQDENIDLLDVNMIENDINNFAFGYLATDINGDGNVDLLDFPIIENNVGSFIFSEHP